MSWILANIKGEYMYNELSEFEEERDLVFETSYQYENYRCQVSTLLTNALYENNDGRSRLVHHDSEIYWQFSDAALHARIDASDFATVLSLDPNFPLYVEFNECACCGGGDLLLTYKYGCVPKCVLE